jgi:hypothetical protein
VRHQHFAMAHASPPHTGHAVPLTFGEADNFGKADRHSQAQIRRFPSNATIPVAVVLVAVTAASSTVLQTGIGAEGSSSNQFANRLGVVIE